MGIHHPRFKELWITHIPRIKLSRKIPREVTILHWKKRIICKTNEERPPVGNQSRTRGVPEISESKPLERSDFLDSEKSFRKIKTNQDNPRNLCKMGFSISKLQRPKERYDFRERSNQNRKCPCGQPLHSPGRKSAEPRCSHKVHQPEDDEDSGGESGDGRNPLLPRESESPRPSHCTGISGSAKRRDKSPIKYAERFKIPAGERSSSRGRRSTKDRFVHPRTSYTGRRESGYLFSYERRTQSEDTRYQKHKMETRSGAATKIADAGIYQASDQVGYYTRTRLQPYLVSKLPAHSLHGSRREQTDKRDHSREESLYQDFTLGQATRPSLGLGLNPQYPKKFQKYGEDFHYTFPRGRKTILKRIFRSVANMVLIQTERNFAFCMITLPYRSMTSQLCLVNSIENTPCRSQCGANCLTILVRPVKAKMIYLPDIRRDPHILQEELQEFSGREPPTPSLASPMQGLLPMKQEKVERVRRILKTWETSPSSSFISKTKMVIKLKTEKTPGTSLKMYQAIASQATRNLSNQSSS